jgi:hypothetical protein
MFYLESGEDALCHTVKQSRPHPVVGGAGINSIQTNLFTVSGKLF